MNTCVLFVTAEGKLFAKAISSSLDDCMFFDNEMKVADRFAYAWDKYDGIIAIMATGIVVRSIAPLIKDKTQDPCVVVLDQKGRYVISLLSGHLGGGNELAVKVARITGGLPVITTASDVLGKTAIDLWAKRNNLVVADRAKLTQLSTRQVNGLTPGVYCNQLPEKIPDDFSICSTLTEADIVITYNNDMTSSALCCIPEILFLGVGCNRGTSVEDIETAFLDLCTLHRIDARAFAGLASIDAKNDEKGILQFAEKHKFAPRFFTKDEINSVDNVSFSAAAMKAVGAQGVAEPTAILAAGEDGSKVELIIRKMKWKDVTLAVAERKKIIWE